MNHCIICNKKDSTPIFTEFNIAVLRCNNCGHVYSSYDAPDNYDMYFKEDIEKADHFWWEEAHRRMYDDFVGRFIVGKSGKLLDFGCGLGYFLKRMSSCPEWSVLGFEISKSAVDFARNKIGLRNIFNARVEDSEIKPNSCDIITMWDVIEHIPNPAPLLKYLRSILKDKGILFIHTPNIKIQLPKARFKKKMLKEDENSHYLEAKDHINIYSPDSITRLLKQNGFNNIKFIHLRPIQSAAGSKSRVLRAAKNGWYNTARLLDLISFGRFNFDNLFVVVNKF